MTVFIINFLPSVPINYLLDSKESDVCIVIILINFSPRFDHDILVKLELVLDLMIKKAHFNYFVKYHALA
jgi:hypothetical protein